MPDMLRIYAEGWTFATDNDINRKAFPSPLFHGVMITVATYHKTTTENRAPDIQDRNVPSSHHNIIGRMFQPAAQPDEYGRRSSHYRASDRHQCGNQILLSPDTLSRLLCPLSLHGRGPRFGQCLPGLTISKVVFIT